VLVGDGQRDGVVVSGERGQDGVASALGLREPESVLLEQALATLRRPASGGQPR